MIDDRLLNRLFKKEEALDKLKIDLKEIESFGNLESLKEVIESIKNYNAMLRQKITFINEDLSKIIPFTRENLYLITGNSGVGKSSVAANVAYPLWQEGKKTLILSNEEPKQDILYRLACLKLGYNFNWYKKGTLTPEMQLNVIKLFPEITEFVKIIDVNYKDGITTKLEGVVNILEAVKNSDFSCVMLDYYQLVKYSINGEGKSEYQILDDLRIYLMRYIKQSSIPVVLFAQLHSTEKRSKSLDSRVKACPLIIEASSVILEIVPDYENFTTSMIIHKDRFGVAGGKVTLGFDNGRYVKLTEEFKRKIIDKKLSDMRNTGVIQ